MSGRTPVVTDSPARNRSRILAVVTAAGTRWRIHRPFPTAELPLVAVGLPLIVRLPPCGRPFGAILSDFVPDRHHRAGSTDGRTLLDPEERLDGVEVAGEQAAGGQA